MTHRQRHLATFAVAMTTIALLASCSSPNPTDGAMKNTITQQEANARVEQYTRDAAAALTPTPRLELLSKFEDSPCDDPTDNGPRGRVHVSRSYWLRDIPKDRNSEVAVSLSQWWQEHNFRITLDKRPQENLIFAEHNTDGFRMSLQEGAQGSLSLGTSSPCVWPNGTPAPKPA
jgi:hypothetical protein